MWAEALTIGGAVLTIVVLVAGGPIVGLVIKRHRVAVVRSATAGAERSGEMDDLHEDKLSPLELAVERRDSAWTAYEAAHLRFLEASTAEHHRLIDEALDRFKHGERVTA
jgi:hypothetical protein